MTDARILEHPAAGGPTALTAAASPRHPQVGACRIDAAMSPAGTRSPVLLPPKRALFVIEMAQYTDPSPAGEMFHVEQREETMERRLGKGLGSLLGTEAVETGAQQLLVPPEQLRPNPFQPRRTFDGESLRELENSIRKHGILHPITVRRAGDRFEIISGERRWRASQAAGLTQVPVSVRDAVDDRSMLELALVENLQRQDLNPLERARGFQTMISELALTQEQVAERVGLRRSTVSNHLRLLELPAQVQDALSRDLIQMGHARALLSLTDARAQTALMEAAVREGWSVRQVEARSRKPEAMPGKAARGAHDRPAAWATDLARRMSEALGTKVRVSVGVGERTQVSIDCYSHAELTRLVDRLAPRPPLR